MHRYAFAVAFALAAPACSLLVDTNGLDSHDVPPKDGGPSSDASADTGVTPASEAGADADTKAFCASRPTATFCEDFSGATVDEKMVLTLEQNAGTAEGTLDTSVFLSPPGSLRVRVHGPPQTPSGDVKEPKFFLSKHVERAVRGVTCEFALLARAAEGDFMIAGIGLTEGQQINVESGYFVTYFYDPTLRAPIGSLVNAPPAWRRYRFGVEANAQSSGANAGKRRVYVEQIEPGTKTLMEFFVTYDTPEPSLDFALGGGGYSPVDLDYNLDDFACTVVAP